MKVFWRSCILAVSKCENLPWPMSGMPSRSGVGQKDADEFIRLFMVPGMQHCGGGAGPYNFGQSSPQTGEDGISSAIERWVEKKVAPVKIIATKHKASNNPASGIARTRPLCPCPQVAKYKGSGSTDEAASFSCVDGK